MKKKKKQLLSGCLSLLACAFLLQGPGHASDPASGTVTESVSASWRGGPLSTAFGPCLGPTDERCDHFTLHVESEVAGAVEVGVTPTRAQDDWDVYVYDSTGLVQRAAANDAPHLHFDHPGGRATYEVRVHPADVLGDATYTGAASWTTPIDVENDCLDLVPSHAGVRGVTDDGGVVTLDLRIVLDGVPEAAGVDIVSRARASYTPLGIAIAPTYHAVDLQGRSADGLIDQAKALYGGRVPDGIDIVYVLTNQNIVDSDGDSGVAGRADCIGGIMSGRRAFAVGERASKDPFGFGPARFQADADAKILAHEVGHLLGAHHHYGNCVEGILTELDRDISPCTLMFVDVFLISMNFSVVNQAVVREYAVRYA